MPATDFQGSSSAASAFGRSILSLRRDQFHAMDHHQHHHPHQHNSDASSLELELEAFQKHVTERFSDLLSSSSTVGLFGSDDLLSLGWIRKLLDSFICCQEEFKIILFNNRPMVSKSPLDRLIHDFFERSVKALDVCNAVRDGIEQIREWRKLVEIVLCALDNSGYCAGGNGGHRFLGEGQFRRAKKALVDLSISLLEDKDSTAAIAHRNRSFGRQHKDQQHHGSGAKKTLGHFRSLSWSVSRSWSAARQLQAIGNNLVAPRANEIVATGGIAVAVFTMSSILLFVMWAMVAAIPCQDRGLQVHFSIPRQFPWAQPVLSLHERVLDESRKRDRRNACGLLKEIHQMDKCARVIGELADSVQFPLTEEKESEVRQRVEGLRHVYERMKEGLDPLERQVREVFHRIVRSRTEGLDSLGRSNHND